MSDFGTLKIQALSEITDDRWNALVKCLEEVDDKIPDERWKFNDLIIDNDEQASALHIRSDGHRNSYITNRNNFVGNKTTENNDLYISSANKIHFQTGDADVNHGKNRLIINKNGVVRLSSDTGWMDIGSKNANWAHFYTDRDKYYFDKEIRVNTGKIGAYDEDLQLCVEGNSKLTILKSNGNVGIGTTTPVTRLHVNGDLTVQGWTRAKGNNGFYFQNHGGGFHMTEKSWIRTYGGKSLLVQKELQIENGWLRVKGKKGVFFQDFGGGFHMTDNTWVRVYNNKNLSINKDLRVNGNSNFKNLTATGVIEARASVNREYSKGRYISNKTTEGKHDRETRPISIFAHNRVVAPHFITYSDKRFKKSITKDLNLDALNKLETCQYIHKTDNYSNNIGFLAQDVEKVLPDAVMQMTGFVPNIFNATKVKAIEENRVSLALPKMLAVQKGDLIKIVTDKEYELEIKEVTEDSFMVDKWEENKLEEVFLYGTKVKDLRAIDYNYIFSLNVAFTQRLQKEVKSLKKKFEKLAFDYNSLKLQQGVAIEGMY